MEMIITAVIGGVVTIGGILLTWFLKRKDEENNLKKEKARVTEEKITAEKLEQERAKAKQLQLRKDRAYIEKLKREQK